jgi:hypothetical protein
MCMKYLGFNRCQKHTEKNKKGEGENVYLTSPEMTVRYARAEIWTRGIEVCKGVWNVPQEGVYLTALFMRTSLNTHPPLHP